MSTAALAAPPGRAATPSDAEERRLDQVIDNAWRRLMGHCSTECPVCGEEMRPDYGAGALPVGGRCQHCHSRLT